MTGLRMHCAKLVLMSSNLERRRSAKTKIRNGEVKFVAEMIDDRRPLHFPLCLIMLSGIYTKSFFQTLFYLPVQLINDQEHHPVL